MKLKEKILKKTIIRKCSKFIIRKIKRKKINF